MFLHLIQLQCSAKRCFNCLFICPTQAFPHEQVMSQITPLVLHEMIPLTGIFRPVCGCLKKDVFIVVLHCAHEPHLQFPWNGCQECLGGLRGHVRSHQAISNIATTLIDHQWGFFEELCDFFVLIAEYASALPCLCSFSPNTWCKRLFRCFLLWLSFQ